MGFPQPRHYVSKAGAPEGSLTLDSVHVARADHPIGSGLSQSQPFKVVVESARLQATSSSPALEESRRKAQTARAEHAQSQRAGAPPGATTK